jgi:hypothetical protein
MRYLVVGGGLFSAFILSLFLSNSAHDVDTAEQLGAQSVDDSDLGEADGTPVVRVHDYLSTIQHEPVPLAEIVASDDEQDVLEIGDAISVSDFESSIYLTLGEEQNIGEYIDANSDYDFLAVDSPELIQGETIRIDDFESSQPGGSFTEALDLGPFIDVSNLDVTFGEPADAVEEISVGEFIPLKR